MGFPPVILMLTALVWATNAQSQPVITEQLYNTFFLHKDTDKCPLAKSFYPYAALQQAMSTFPSFASEGSSDTQKREAAAFLAVISHKTTGGWETASDPYTWGLCYKEEVNPSENCDATYTQWPCVPGKSYKGRGPIQLSWNYNYGPSGKALGFDGLNNPDAVANDSVLAFRTALWYWMTPQPPAPSCHDVMVGRFTPSPEDVAANRVAGFGLVTNIVDGHECGRPVDARINESVGYFSRYAQLLGVDVGSNLHCANQKPYGLTYGQQPSQKSYGSYQYVSAAQMIVYACVYIIVAVLVI